MSPECERRIARLAKRRGLKTKAGVVRLALAELERRVAWQQTGTEIRDYARKYGRADRRENALLSAAGVGRTDR